MDIRNILLSLGGLTCALFFIWPFANLPYGDDTAYSYIALGLARTGKIVYNGWEVAGMISHAYWGALFIRLFGFSFNCLRLSTFPFVLGTLAFCYLLSRRMGLSAMKSLLVTLTFGLSPIFLPVAASYMTDVPALFFIFASFYCLVRAFEASAESKGNGWLLLGVAVAFVGGTGRQTVWFVPLILLPHLAWVRRKTPFGLMALCGWLVMGAILAPALSWLNSQPYIVYQPSLFAGALKLVRYPLATVNIVARFLMMLLLLCLPAALPLAVRSAQDALRGNRRRQAVIGVLLLGVFAAIFIHPSLASIPWAYSTLDWSGVNGDAPLPGRPIVLIRPVRAIVAVVIYVVACLILGEAANLRELAGRAWEVIVDEDGKNFALAAMTRFSVIYFAFIIVRSTDFDIFDRHLLPVIPWAATVFLLWSGTGEKSVQTCQPVARYSWAALGVLALYGIANTQDLWALARARAEAAQRLVATGIPRTAIDAAFEYNMWTQLTTAGRANSRWVVNPPGAYDPGKGQTPVVVPQYVLEYALTPETEPTSFGSVAYRTFLPPYGKQVRIDKIKNAKPN